MNDLEKMDAIKVRMNVTYSQAKEALDLNDGDLAKALVYLEQKDSISEDQEPKWNKDNVENFARGIIEQIKAIIQEGNVSKVRLKQGEKVIIEIPATLGVVGVGALFFSPLLFALGAIGAATAFINELTIELERPDGTIESRELKLKNSKKAEEWISKVKDEFNPDINNEEEPEE